MLQPTPGPVLRFSLFAFGLLFGSAACARDGAADLAAGIFLGQAARFPDGLGALDASVRAVLTVR